MTLGAAGGFEEACASSLIFSTKVLFSDIFFHDDLVVLFATGEMVVFFVGGFVYVSFDETEGRLG